MDTALHSFMDIFNTEFLTDSGKILLKEITIPIIQRDYAQGRLDPDATRVRKRFLKALMDAVVGTPITLDFVYGDIDENGIMTPLDGQQRLTTLFLLHWYAAKKEKIQYEQYAFLKHFSYKVRYSARDFCTELINYTPTFNGKKISDDIVNQSWFPLDWRKDPTISSMLVMIDAIDEQFKGVDGIWQRLADNSITFYFLPIKNMGLTDELYIKMNSRGKPLTIFEHFKAELEHEIKKVNEKTAEDIIAKIDREWTDLLWQYRNSGSGNSDDVIIDDEFLRYFKFICDIICYQNGESPQIYSDDEFGLIERYFSEKCIHAKQNLETLEKFFNCWCKIDGFDCPKDFLYSFMGQRHCAGKIVVDSRYSIDIFGDCLRSYSDKTGRIRLFPLNRIVLLYAIVVYLQNQDTISRKDFERRIRIVNNLIQNSEDEISDRADRNRIPAILSQVDSIIIGGVINDKIAPNFNDNQLKEETEKIEYLAVHPEQSATLFALEDHPMLKGQIAIIGMENLTLANNFEKLFTCAWDKIDCALMSIGDYGQQEKNGWRYQYASKSMQFAWDGLFHRSANIGFDNTKAILIKLLQTVADFSNDTLDKLAQDFIRQCEKDNVFPWRYYYVKYAEYRPGSYGKLCNIESGAKRYLLAVMQTRTQWSENTYIPYLKIADGKHLSRDSYGQRLVYSDKYIVCENAAYVVKNNDNDEIERVDIKQNSDGIDIVDRVVLLKNYIASIV